MNRELDLLKRRLRAEAKARRAALSEVERTERSAQAHEVLLSSEAWSEASTIGLFCSMVDEIETRPLLAAAWDAGKQVALPCTPPLGNALQFRWVTQETELSPSSFGVYEPGPEAKTAQVADLDLLIVPGLAFDVRGARLGYGGGYYDRTLSEAKHSVMLAFACQHFEQVPEGQHDKRVDAVVTEDGARDASSASAPIEALPD